MATISPVVYALESLGRSARDVFKQSADQRRDEFLLTQQGNEQQRALETLRLQGERQQAELELKGAESAYNIQKGKKQLEFEERRIAEEGKRTGILQQQADTQTQAQKDTAAHNQGMLNYHNHSLELARQAQRDAHTVAVMQAKAAQMNAAANQQHGAFYAEQTLALQNKRKAEENLYNTKVNAFSMMKMMHGGDKVPEETKQFFTSVLSASEHQGDINLNTATLKYGDAMKLFESVVALRAAAGKQDDSLIKTIAPHVVDAAARNGLDERATARLMQNTIDAARNPQEFVQRLDQEKDISDVLKIELFKVAKIDPATADKKQIAGIEDKAYARMRELWAQGVRSGDQVRSLLTQERAAPAANAPPPPSPSLSALTPSAPQKLVDLQQAARGATPAGGQVRFVPTDVIEAVGKKQISRAQGRALLTRYLGIPEEQAKEIIRPDANEIFRD